MKSASELFTEIIKDNDLKGISSDMSEAIFDSFLDDGIIKDIPVINIIRGLIKSTNNIKEVLFMKKVLYFLSELNDIPFDKRQKEIENIESSKKYNLKVGEKLMFIIDKAEDYELSGMYGKLFSAFIKGNISYDDFLKAINCIEKIYLGDLKNFILSNFEILKIEESGPYLSCGLFDITPLKLQINEKEDYGLYGMNHKKQFEIKGHEIKTHITIIGKLIRVNLR